jgi:hypothetical protein
VLALKSVSCPSLILIIVCSLRCFAEAQVASIALIVKKYGSTLLDYTSLNANCQKDT